MCIVDSSQTQTVDRCALGLARSQLLQRLLPVGRCHDGRCFVRVFRRCAETLCGVRREKNLTKGGVNKGNNLTNRIETHLYGRRLRRNEQRSDGVEQVARA